MVFTEYINRIKEITPTIFNKISQAKIELPQTMSYKIISLTIVFVYEIKIVNSKSIKMINTITKKLIYLAF